ncbi:MFS transporter [Pseudooceanicola algae]|uniref:Uncharacterized protein n=1 Tax=Pseudooceanicola algae TaxID=1537215 RepID=A0A418SGP3_9RHOB|nr:MFS transporter [Pseudooceanicola algae]QPM88912.1 hypothetical protein PSAL_001150 [Pseudooceanicola algae]
MSQAEHTPRSRETTLFARLSGGGDPDATESANGLRIAASLSMTKISDGLIDPKLVLSWLLSALGAPAVFAGALVPIREAGALLPQILLAGAMGRLARKKWMWVAGAALQGVAALLIALAGLGLEGSTAGAAICAALALLALARSACSVSFKVVLGRSVEKTRRGAITGIAGSLASGAVVIFALLLISGLFEARGPVLAAITLAGVLWLAAAGLFATLDEEPGKTGDSAPPPILGTLREDPMLRRFILARGLLVTTALAPPYIVMIAGGEGGAVLGQLGALVLASAAASFLASYVWGRLADRSSRWVLVIAGGLGGLAMAAMPVLGLLGQADNAWVGPAVLFVLMLAYHGVRQGRSTYLVDMAPEDKRAAYSAVANTLIGCILLLAGALGGSLSLLGPEAALAGFAALSALGGGLCLGLREVETA